MTRTLIQKPTCSASHRGILEHDGFSVYFDLHYTYGAETNTGVISGQTTMLAMVLLFHASSTLLQTATRTTPSASSGSQLRLITGASAIHALAFIIVPLVDGIDNVSLMGPIVVARVEVHVDKFLRPCCGSFSNDRCPPVKL